MLFDRGDALKRVVDLFAEAGDVLEFFHEVIEVVADRFKFGADGSEFFAHDRVHVVLVAMCLTRWESISPISCKVVFFAAINNLV